MLGNGFFFFLNQTMRELNTVLLTVLRKNFKDLNERIRNIYMTVT